MKILMRRQQTPGRFFAVTFKLWAKLELEGDEQAIIDRYDFDQVILVNLDQENRVRNALIVGLIASVPVFFLIAAPLGRATGSVAAIAALVGVAWFLMDRWRETIYVKDLLHGRNFRCRSIVELVKKEAFLANYSATLRQVMETAKHWDGTEVRGIPPLDPELAKWIVVKS